MSENRGEAGVAGRQGEAGVSGPQGEAGRQGPPGDVTQGHPGPRGRRGPGITNTQVTAVFLFVVLAFCVLSIRSEIQQRHINRNTQQIVRNQHDNALLQYTICTDRNARARDQIRLIDSAIQAEKRKPHPDKIRIRDLEKFKPATPNCGPKP